MENVLVVSGISLRSIAALLPISVLMLFLPGLFLTRLFFRDVRLGWFMGFAASVGLSAALSIIISTVVLIANLRLGWLLGIELAMAVVLGGLAWLHARRRPKTQGEPSERRLTPWLLGALVVGTAFVIWRFWVPINRFEVSLDFWSYLCFVRKWATMAPRPLVDVRLGTSADSFRYLLGGWMLVQSLLSVGSGIDPIDISAWWLPPILMMAFFASQYALAKALFRNRNVAAFSALVTILSVGLLTNGRESLGQVLFNRVNEDKFLLTFLLLPVALTFMFRYLRSKRKGDLAAFIVLAVSLPLTHPLGLVEIGLAFGLFAIVQLALDRRREALMGLGAILVPLVLLLVVPLAERTVATKPYSLDGPGGMEIYESFHTNHLVILDAARNLYITHPGLLNSPITIAALVLTPLLFLFVRRDVGARFLLGNMLGLGLILFTPLFAPLLGRVITPWMLWRLTYLMPSSLIVGYFLAQGLEYLEGKVFQRRPAVAALAPLALLLTAGIAFQGTGIMKWPALPATPIYVREADLLLKARELVPEPSVIMCTVPLQQMLPAFMETGFVPTWLQNNPVDDQVLSFYGGTSLDEAAWQTLATFHASYLVADLRTNSFLLPPSELLTPLYANKRYVLYQVGQTTGTPALVQANTALESGEPESALALYQQVATTSPLQSLLGQAQVRAAQGRDEEARSLAEQAVAEFPDSVWSWLELAEVARLAGDAQAATAAYVKAYGQLSSEPFVPDGLRSALVLLARQGMRHLLAVPASDHERWGVSLNRAYGNLGDYDLTPLRIGWFADWGYRMQPPYEGSPEHAQIVPVGLDDYPPVWASVEKALRDRRGDIWLVGIWPEWSAGGNRTPAEYAEIYHEVYQVIRQRDLSAVIAAGGIVEPTPARLKWLDDVLDAYKARYGVELPADAWQINVYILREEQGSWGAGLPVGEETAAGQLYEVADNANPEILKSQVLAFRQWMADHGERGKPLIISGYGVQMPSDYLGDGDIAAGNQKVSDFMRASFDLFSTARDPLLGCPGDDNRLVQRWLWNSLNDPAADPETGAVSNGTLFVTEGEEARLSEFGAAFADYMVDVP